MSDEQYKFAVARDHWLDGAEHMPTTHMDRRPDAADISLVVIHAISLPPGEFGAGLVPMFFRGTLDVRRHPALADLEGVRLSSHLFIDRDGAVVQFVPFHRRAWHAGVSSHCGRANCNDYSVGIELEGTDDAPYTDAQYERLGAVLDALLRRYDALSHQRIVGHADIAPGRKTDPGPCFDWPRLRNLLATVRPPP